MKKNCHQSGDMIDSEVERINTWSCSVHFDCSCIVRHVLYATKLCKTAITLFCGCSEQLMIFAFLMHKMLSTRLDCLIGSEPTEPSRARLHPSRAKAQLGSGIGEPYRAFLQLGEARLVPKPDHMILIYRENAILPWHYNLNCRTTTFR